LKINRLNFF